MNTTVDILIVASGTQQLKIANVLGRLGGSTSRPIQSNWDGRVIWIENVYQLTARLAQSKLGQPTIVCVLIDSLSRSELGIFGTLDKLEWVTAVAFSFHDHSHKAIISKNLGAEYIAESECLAPFLDTLRISLSQAGPTGKAVSEEDIIDDASQTEESEAGFEENVQPGEIDTAIEARLAKMLDADGVDVESDGAMANPLEEPKGQAEQPKDKKNSEPSVNKEVNKPRTSTRIVEMKAKTPDGNKPQPMLSKEELNALLSD